MFASSACAWRTAHYQPHALAALQDRRGAARRQLTDHIDRHPHVSGQHRGSVKILRRDADHGERTAVQLQRPADNRRIAVEAADPEVVTQDGERRAARLFAVFRCEQPADVGTGAEDTEVVRRHHVAVDAFGAIASAEAHRLRSDAIRVNPCQDRVPRADIEVVRVGTVVEALAVLRAADVHQTIGLDNAGRRLEQQGVRDGEDGGICADADGQRQRGGQ